jgi:hypothetical protein
MPAEIQIQDEQLIVKIHGIDKLLSFTGSLTIPLEHISSVEKAPEISRKEIGVKLVGAGIPGLIRAGTYAGDQGLAFWDVRNYDNAILLHLHDERYSQLFLDVGDPEKAIAEIEAALRK